MIHQNLQFLEPDNIQTKPLKQRCEHKGSYVHLYYRSTGLYIINLNPVVAIRRYRVSFILGGNIFEYIRLEKGFHFWLFYVNL